MFVRYPLLSLLIILVCLRSSAATVADSATGFENAMRPLLKEYCFDCHQGEDANGDVAFDRFGDTPESVADAFQLWESVAGHLTHRTMPPDDSPQPSEKERQLALEWYEAFVDSIEARPAVLHPRRLSVIEYRNTLRSLLGFDLVSATIEAEQTDVEKSLVVKLLPTDPPGGSGFTNDTHANALTTLAWDQYTHLVEIALEELFSTSRRNELEHFSGPLNGDGEMTFENCAALIRNFHPRAMRRRILDGEVEKIVSRLQGLEGEPLANAIKFELRCILLSPGFLYRGFHVNGQRGTTIDVDACELAERLSYFLWADMPDQELLLLAQNGQLADQDTLLAQVDRMLASPKARSLSKVFASEWFTLSEIDLAEDNVPIREALKSQPVDFMHYLFTQDRPLIELIDSDVSFINSHTGRMYGPDAKQLKRYQRSKGIEIETLPNQQIALNNATERGGLLTMPGILAMNRGPILRGTWILERILGEHLPDPPANVGQVQANAKGEKLTFRQRFEKHRSSEACAVCHDKIDPLGFSLQLFDERGQYRLAKNYRAKGSKNKQSISDPAVFDTSGQLPSGEAFADVNELKKILSNQQRKAVIRNMVRRTLAYALCRRLEVFDQPTVDRISDQMMKDSATGQTGTWRDLFHAIVTSIPFRQTILSP